MEKLIQLACSINYAARVGKSNQALNDMVELYQTVQRAGGRTLLNIDNSSDLQCVGIAYTYMALLFLNGDGCTDINSVAAENAYYCLSRSYLDYSNTYGLPALFTLLTKEPNLMVDKFKLINAPNICNLASFIQLKFNNEVLNNITDTVYFILRKFYNIGQKQFIIPTDVTHLIPAKTDISQFLNSIQNTDNIDEVYNDGEVYFGKIYNECRNTLMNF